MPTNASHFHTAPASGDALLSEVLEGLRRDQATLPSRLLYDEEGSRIYDEITELEEYYPYRAEVDILTRHGSDLASMIGPGRFVIEYGAGSGVKTRLLLDSLRACAGIVLVDISGEHLAAAAAALARRYPALRIEALCANFIEPLVLPEAVSCGAGRLAFFPGSTIGNFDPSAAVALLANILAVVGSEGHLLVGVDVPKDREMLELAYDDALGVTARFNLNILEHVNRLFRGDFDVESYCHEARWNAAHSRIEMHLRCLRDQQVILGGERFSFERGETIRTECSYKFSPDMFRTLCAQAGFEPLSTWFDASRRYTLHLLRAA